MRGRFSPTTIVGNLQWHLLGILGKKFVVRNVHGFQMELHMKDQGLSKQLFVHGKREAEHAFILQKVVRPGIRILEIGANIGYYCLLEKRLAPDSQIIAAEPHPENFRILERNLAGNRIADIETHCVAVSDTTERSTLHTSRMGNCHSLNPEPNAKVAYTGCLEVPTTTVEKLANRRSIDLIRMDIEGHEVRVFRSLRQTLLRQGCFPAVLFEVHRKKYHAQNSLARELEEFHRHGYHAQYLGTSGPKGTAMLSAQGLPCIAKVESDHTVRGVFTHVRIPDLIRALDSHGGIRAVCLSRPT